MMKVFRYVLIALLVTLMSSHARSQSYIAYDLTTAAAGPSYAGTQAFGGTVAMAFDVNSQAIQVTSLGIFDSNRDGFHNTLTTYIYDRDTHALLASQTFSGTSDATAGVLSGYHRFINTIGGLRLSAGHYLIAADGFSTLDLEGNANVGTTFVHDTFDNGGGLITTLPPTLYGLSPGAYPTFVASSTDSLSFNAGSFTYSLDVPEPGSVALLMGMVGVGGVVIRRSSRRRPAKKSISRV